MAGTKYVLCITCFGRIMPNFSYVLFISSSEISAYLYYILTSLIAQLL
jgi:hypothetical protein